MAKTLLAGTAAALLVVAAQAQAEVLTIVWESTLTAPAGTLPSAISVHGTLTYDTDAVPIATSDFTATYHPLSVQIEIESPDGSGIFEASAANSLIQVQNDQPSFGGMFVDGFAVFGRFQGTPSFLGFPIVQFGFFVEQRGAVAPDVLASTALLATQAQLDGFGGSRIASVEFNPASGFFAAQGRLALLEFEVDEPPLVAACEGFYAPFDGPIGLTRKERRVIPLRMNLLDENGVLLTPDDIAAPLVSVTRSASVSNEDLETLVDSPGRATSGNEFVWNETTQQWEYNLSSAPFSAAGTYTVTALPGDMSHVIVSNCTGVFVRQ